MAVPTLVSATVGATGLTLTTVWSENVGPDLEGPIMTVAQAGRQGTIAATYSSGTGTTTLVFSLAGQVYQATVATASSLAGLVLAISTSDPSGAFTAFDCTNGSTVSWMLRCRRRFPAWGRSRR